MTIAVEVAVAAPIPRTLTYLIEDATGGDADALIGRRAIVPLGNRRLTGYILSIWPEIPASDFTLKAICALADDGPLFPARQIPLFRWLSEYYHYPIGEVIATVLPAGLSRKSARRLELADSGALAAAAPEPDAPWWPKLKEQGQLSARETQAILKIARGKRLVRQLSERGLIRLREELTGRKRAEKWQFFYRLAGENRWHDSFGDKASAPADAAALRRFLGQFPDTPSVSALSVQARKTLFFLHKLTAADAAGSQAAGGGEVSGVALRQAYGPALAALPELISQGWAVEERRLAHKNLFGEDIRSSASERFALSDEQALATNTVGEALEAAAFTTFLLHGVTGSGKTEVYLRLAEKCLNMGKSALILVPEIALATQLEEYFLARFSDQVALLHSGLSDGERLEQWSLILSGAKRLVIGARSAVFAPVTNLGLIVVDEEHDGGFKQDDGLRYQGRDVAVMRGKLEQAVVLLASATPSVQSAYNAESGKYRLLTMKNRVGGQAPPAVVLLNLAERAHGRRRLFLPPLAEALRANLARGKQSVLLLNRRGFAASLVCQECGAAVECVNCRVTLTLHKSRGQLLCHYCGHAIRPETICARCGSMALAPIGFGIERVEDEARELFPEARIARVDTDAASDRRRFLAILRAMKAGEIDILVGTQMVAKGHHFPNVTLVGVVWADGGLGLPDFRAGEKTFQLITQVIGRAGRGGDSGQVFIQTFRPDHYAIAYAQANRHDLLVQEELRARREPLFPPYVRLALLHIQGEDEDAASDSALAVARFCRGLMKKEGGLELLGPMPSPIERLRRKYRRQILIKSASMATLHQLLSQLNETKTSLLAAGCSLAIDVDPENML
ncbi:MAG: primosomal protein N' [Desulfobulbaceae bacterium]|jgi:primosomal protein N' (replication factor Y)|nr:primosomal protein N' [Desulfobulbaceae bacterium]